MEPVRDERDRIIAKVTNYKAIIKVKEGKIREMMGLIDVQGRRVSELEEQAEKLISALKKQKSAEERQLDDHFYHLQN